ncbi:MAG: dTDP-4-dehydrorhamnose reductase family protein [Pyrinomonadaceae bacterium]
MKVLVLGGSGLLGHKLAHVFKSRFETYTTFHGSFDRYRGLDVFDGVEIVESIEAQDLESVARALAEIRPDTIVNAIGVTKHVPDVANTVKTIAINSLLPHQLAEIAATQNARLICISTDCVFSGNKGNYVETDAPDATDLYGKSKNLGEVVDGDCLTIRTSIIGRELFTRNSLVEWFLSNRGGRVKGFKKAIFSGFPTLMLANILADLIANRPGLRGLYHVSSDPINKFDLLQLISDEMGAGIELEADTEVAIDRSLDSKRFRTDTGFAPQSWPEMVREMVDDARSYEAIK